MQDATIYDYTRAKMVDLGVGIRPPPRIADKIDQILISLPYSHQCINQTVYGPVRKNPLVMVIKTKLAEGDLEEARLQLGVWVASWHQRIAVLFGGHLAGNPVITLPLIIVMEHQWRLLLACDRMDRLVSILHITKSRLS
ncbi:hypothetical protein FSARC_14102 [Fusarium sarcochroum]|uniref:PD-(D/E)XK nuclease-like domain-containing protein n=1 Tax=Fusarium sarcochroum TaxID=1208366 RepID=A0A8H4SW27_9HYPO|nr:hypothetical protein FSARC_14102 [Fusarium sarcochroum]